MRRVRSIVLLIAGLSVAGCSAENSPAGNPPTAAAPAPDSHLIPCDASWACLSQVAAKVKHAVWATAGDRKVVVGATVDVNASTSSSRVNYIWLTAGGAQVNVYGTAGHRYPTGSGTAMTLKGSAATLLSPDPDHATIVWSNGGWTWQISAAGPSPSEVVTREAEGLRPVSAVSPSAHPPDSMTVDRVR